MKQPRILIADDRAEDRYLLKCMLESSGFRVDTASTGLDALEIAERDLPDAVVCDVFMPRMDGFELCRRWNANDRLKKIPFLLCSNGVAESDDERLGLELGACSYINKPIDGHELTAMLQDLLNSRAAGGDFHQSSESAPRFEVNESEIDLLQRKLDQHLRGETNAPIRDDLRQESPELARTRRILLGLLEDARQSAEQAREGEARFRRVLSSLDQVVWACDLDGRLQYISPAVESVYGISVEDCHRDPDFWLNAVVPEDREIALASSRDVLISGSIDVEYRIQRADGQVRWLQDRKKVFRRAGSPAGISGICLDVTDRKEAEIMQRRLSQSLTRAQSMANLGSWEWDPQTGEGWWSDQLYQMFDRDPDNGPLALDEFLELVHPDDRDRLRAGMVPDELVLSPQRLEIEFRSNPELGSLRYFAGVRDFSERAGKWLFSGTTQDVTRQKQTERALRESRNLLKTITDSTPGLIAYIDSDGRYRYVNANYEMQFHRPASEVLGQHVNDVLPKELLDVARPHIEAALRGKRQQFEICLPPGIDGDAPSYAYVIYVPDIDADGLVKGFYLLALDVTALKEAEASREAAQNALAERLENEKEIVAAELEKMRTDLVRSTRLATVGRVAAQMAHELRNPLGTVRNGIYLIRKDLREDQEPVLQTLELIEEELSAADLIIRNLLMATAGTRIDRQQVDVLEKIRKSVRRVIHSDRIAVSLDVPEKTVLLNCDPLLFRQLIDNLLDNARSAIGESDGKIEVSVSRRGEEIEISVTDDGPGIPPEIKDTVFEPFVTGRPDGTGLGLSICQQIVEQHDGTIFAEDAEPAGTRMIVRFRATDMTVE